MKRILLPLIALLVLLAAASTAHAFAGRNGAIVYGWSGKLRGSDTTQYQHEIRLVTPSGTTPRTLASCDRTVPEGAADPCFSTPYSDPAFAPDGSRIAFDAGHDLAIVNVDGSDMRLLPAHSLDDGEPAFSPSGARLVFSVEAGSPAFSRRDVWVSDVRGRSARRLVSLAVDPTWSARNWIAFARGGQIFCIRPDGSGMHQLTRAGGESPAWSPHGTMLAFTRAAGVFVTGADGRHTRRISTQGQQVSWSPDGHQLVVRLRGRAVETIDLATRRRHVVATNTPGTAVSGGVDWQPLR